MPPMSQVASASAHARPPALPNPLKMAPDAQAVQEVHPRIGWFDTATWFNLVGAGAKQA